MSEQPQKKPQVKFTLVERGWILATIIVFIIGWSIYAMIEIYKVTDSLIDHSHPSHEHPHNHSKHEHVHTHPPHKHPHPIPTHTHKHTHKAQVEEAN